MKMLKLVGRNQCFRGYTVGVLRTVFIFVSFLLLMSACAGDTPPEVGSRDCAVLQDLPSGALCDQCQGVSCDQTGAANSDGCEVFPCVDGVRVVQGCEEDSDCGEFDGMWCGMGTSPHWHMCGTIMGDM